MIMVNLDDGRSFPIEKYLDLCREEIALAEGLDKKIAEAKVGMAALNANLAENRTKFKECETALRSFYSSEPIVEPVASETSAVTSIATFLGARRK